MIDQTAITQWRKQKPWDDIVQVEQDHLICRCLVAIYSDEYLASQLAFRGSTQAEAVQQHDAFPHGVGVPACCSHPPEGGDKLL